MHFSRYCILYTASGVHDGHGVGQVERDVFLRFHWSKFVFLIFDWLKFAFPCFSLVDLTFELTETGGDKLLVSNLLLMFLVYCYYHLKLVQEHDKHTTYHALMLYVVHVCQLHSRTYINLLSGEIRICYKQVRTCVLLAIVCCVHSLNLVLCVLWSVCASFSCSLLSAVLQLLLQYATRVCSFGFVFLTRYQCLQWQKRRNNIELQRLTVYH